MIVACFFYTIWGMRNNKLFVGSMNVSHAVEKWEMLIREFSEVTKVQIPANGAIQNSVKWCPYERGLFAINVDAAWLNGKSAAAMIVRDCLGKVIFVGFYRFFALFG